MSQHFNTTKAQRKMIRRWCLENNVYVNSHPQNLMKPISKTHNGMEYCVGKNYNKPKYTNIEFIAWLDWRGQSLEELAEACAYLRMTQPTKTAIVALVRTPPPTPPSRSKHDTKKET